MGEKIGLYIHIPYCESKCGYCDFSSYVNKRHTIPDYIDAVILEATRYAGCVAETVYLGGGTPSCLNTGDIARLLEGIHTHIPFAEGAEITAEANPNSLSRQKAAEFWNAGINRLSMGLQATQAPLLKRIGRTHVYADFLKALEHAMAAGFTDLSADLMYSLPDQTVEQAVESAQLVSELPLTHISAYALRLERGTPLYGAPQPDEEMDRAMFYGMMEVFRSHGFARYEISNFAKPGFESKHNLKYWRQEAYVGLGAAAHSCYHGQRYGNTASIEGYIKHIRAGESAAVQREAEEPLLEGLMLRTRMCEGIPLTMLPQTGKLQKLLQLMEQNGLIIRTQDRAILTDAGMDIHNTVVLELQNRIEEF